MGSLLVGSSVAMPCLRISTLAPSQSQFMGTTMPMLSSSLSLSLSSPPSLPSTTITIYCGRGDRKTAKGKRFNHSFGNARPRNKKKGRGPPRIPVPSSQPVKDKFDDEEVVTVEIDESLFSG